MTILFVHNDLQFNEVLSRIVEYLTTNGNFDLTIESLFTDPDVHIFKRDNKNKTIGITAIKEFIKTLRLKPFKHNWQIAIINDFELLTIQAQNSLLKELEEHSAKLVYVIITKNINMVLETIRSRAQIVYLNDANIDFSVKNLREDEDPFWKVYSNLSTMNIDKIEAYNIVKNYKNYLFSVAKDSKIIEKKLKLVDYVYKLLSNNISPKKAILFLYTFK